MPKFKAIKTVAIFQDAERLSIHKEFPKLYECFGTKMPSPMPVHLVLLKNKM
jgi:hypothetical protein